MGGGGGYENRREDYLGRKKRTTDEVSNQEGSGTYGQIGIKYDDTCMKIP